MTEINWNNFRAKFNGKETVEFENLAYQLFCNEFSRPFGIFRFKNQTGIETEPIIQDKKCTGFQAKYYETKISENKQDIIDSVKKAKAKNPELEVVYLYTNKELSESSKKADKNPQYKIDIEKETLEMGITIQWRVPSHFEIQLAQPQNQYLAQYFFNLGKDTIDFINSITEHTANLLFPIQDCIAFVDKNIKVNRTAFLDNIQSSAKSKIMIISGEGGCGKTGMIKNYFQRVKNLIPFYTFKATEFNVTDINHFFKRYGNYNLKDFLEIHKDEKEKIIVIDSAENLAELQNQEPFKELVSALLQNSWKIIFTTRPIYLDDLKFQFIEIYRLGYEHLAITKLTLPELKALAEEHNFELPTDESLLTLLTNLFYLDEYLQNYTDRKEVVNSGQFTKKLWQRKIQNSSYTINNLYLERENCFLEIAKLRSSSGNFFVIPKNHCSPEALRLLEKDEIISLDTASGGYFITHDIYEEWALDIYIERTFLNSADYVNFFIEIGTSLPIRRAFRKWLSMKLRTNLTDIKPLFNHVFFSKTNEAFWNDEVIISILLSDYSSEFFQEYESFILDNYKLILKKISFLLRIACKEVDDMIYKLLGEKNQIDLGFIFTKPKGNGWKNTIDLMYGKIGSFSHDDLPIFIPLYQDWTEKNKRGETTRTIGLIALHFYKEMQFNKEIRSSNKSEERLIKIILNAALELKDELQLIFNEVIKNKWTKNNDAYHDLCLSILKSPTENLSVIVALPEVVIKIADLFWFKGKKRSDPYRSDFGTEQHYGLSSSVKHNFAPASALQTPTFLLLRSSFSEAIDFILEFTNKCVSIYADADFDLDSINEIELYITPELTKKQFASHALYQMFRGVSSPVTPYILQSMHMALEKDLLERAKNTDPVIMESWLLYLLKKSDSISITAVVASIVLANPDKFFKIASILFKTLDLYHYDNYRLHSEHQCKGLYSIGYGMNYESKIFEDERIQTCEDKHRQLSLENLVVNYQFFKNSDVTDDEVETRQQQIYNTIDDAKLKLESVDQKKEKYKVFKLFLARIDRRNMNPIVTQKEDKILIDFNPTIEPELEEHRQEKLSENFNMTRFSALKFWSENKFNHERKYGDYPQYENNPQLIFDETKEVIKMLNNPNEDSYPSFNSAIPSYTCAALIRFYFSELNDEQKSFCKEYVLGYATLPLQENYGYQISDGVEVAVNALPYLMEKFPEEIPQIKLILLFILFDNYPLGEYKRVCDYAIEAMYRKLWSFSLELSNDILIGYLKFAPLYEKVKQDYRKKNRSLYDQNSGDAVREQFANKYKKELEKYLSKSSDFGSIDLKNISATILETAFKIIPFDTKSVQHLSLVKSVLPILFAEFLPEQRNRDADYRQNRRFYKRYAKFILHRELSEIDTYLQPLIENFTNSREVNSLLVEIISAEDQLAKYDQFWVIWNNLFPSFSKLFDSDKHFHYENEIVHSYLLAWPYWSSTAKKWHSLKSKEKLFYSKIISTNGDHPAVLYSTVKLLNEIGSDFIDDGIIWISDLLAMRTYKNLETNTVYYMEIIIRKHIYLNRMKIRKNMKIKNRVLQILNFLIERSSVSAYLLREDIL
ncbi:ATP-binding protein [Flavobacterium sp. P4023]|uniref:ATP-binding protein n=1 Tax=Flavobacterium flabelliforme TaxID=2816119 RepID=A0ABS5CTQ1_9FLAO|nr:AVAST type 4 anti-phage nuclease Avs4 [Flavobacterium flabelliforme]MBP4141987.1 ATP-binding protein [Flavobacterium flabelliforme]